jgi:hypothetical protein
LRLAFAEDVVDRPDVHQRIAGVLGKRRSTRAASIRVFACSWSGTVRPWHASVFS